MRKLTMRALPFKLPGYPDPLAALLHARGVNTKQEADQFLNPEINQLHDPFLLHDIQKACDLINQATRDNTPIAVYGDYDADGVCATAIMLDTLKSLGAQAFSYIPERQAEGYGLNLDAVRMLAKRAGMLISVDCGITAFNETRLAKSLGMRVILTDHHTIPASLPPADAVIHPQMQDYPFPHLCGTGIAFKLALALLGLKKAESFLDLAALATIADLVPLTGENRVIASLGLKKLAKTGRPGLLSLMRVAGIPEGKSVSSGQVAFQLAPRLNAGGRLQTAETALLLLLTKDEKEAEKAAEELDKLNLARRDLEGLLVREAQEMVAKMNLSALRSLVVAKEGWNTGVVGLAASKLAERWSYPSIVLCVQGEEISGSGRGVNGIDLYAAIFECKDLLTRFGGHKMAAGLSLPLSNLAMFQARFDQAVRRQLGNEDLFPETIYDCPLALKDADLEIVSALEQLAPFGMGNPSPLFLFEDIQLISARAVGKDAAHLKMTVAQNGAQKEGIAFSQGRMLPELGQELALISSVDENEFNGRVTAQLIIKAILPGQNAFCEDPLKEAAGLLKALMSSASDNGDPFPVEQIEKVLTLQGSRGTLIIARCVKTANSLHKRFPQLQTQIGSAKDPRAFHTLVLRPDWQQPFAGFDRVILADGLLYKEESAQIHQATGASQILVMPQSTALLDLLRCLRISKDSLRQAYIRLRKGERENLTGTQTGDLAALHILKELNLVQLDENMQFSVMMPMTRCEPEESPLYRALISL